MTKTFATDSNNDLYIGPDGNLAIASGLQAVLQLCANAAKAQLGEMVLATDQGIPNFQIIWNGVPNVAQFEAALRVTLLGVPDVIEILNLNAAVSGKTLSYSATIDTIYGTGVING